LESTDININTPVKDILDQGGVNQKGWMSRLGMIVFDRFGGPTLKAFTQFEPADLAVVIEAKRKGVFDYGVCIRDTGAGWTWPSNPKAVLAAVALAEEGKHGEINLGSLALVDTNKNPIPDHGLKQLCPGIDAKPSGQPAEAPTGDDPKKVLPFTKPQDAAPLQEVPPAAEKKTRKKKEQPALPVVKEEKPSDTLKNPEYGGSEVDVIIERIDKLSEGLVDAFETVVAKLKETDQKRASIVEDELGYVKEEVENVKAGLVGLWTSLEVMDRNMRQILMFTFGDAVVFEDLPKAAEILMQSATPDDLEERISKEVPKAEKEEVPPEKESPQVTPPGNLPIYTKEQLESMNITDLREYGSKLGVEPAKWVQTQISRILKEYESRGIKPE
jgi:hypothetical protein